MTDKKISTEKEENKSKEEIQIENKDLLNIFFDNSGSQFESQFYLSRKRMLNAENGQTESSELLKSKLKALDMMLLILANNKNILKESDLSCCEVLNNLLSESKKDKAFGEHIYSKIKSIMIYFIKNKISLQEKNSEENKVLIKFLLTLYNIKFDNNYFKQTLDIISQDKDFLELFIHELFNKLFKGRNITIKIKEMKFILKSLLINEKINTIKNYFDIMELLMNYIKEKQNGGCRTIFQLNQVIFLLQYLLEIININEIKKLLPDKKEQKMRLIKIIEIFKDSINDLINKEDYEFDKNMSKKNLEIKNENIKRKKNIFREMLNFLNKLKKNFDVINDKEFKEKLGEINDLYKNIINIKYVIIIGSNNDNNKKITEKPTNEITEDNKDNKEKDEINSEDNEEKEERSIDEENLVQEEKDNELEKKENELNDDNDNKNEELELEEEPEIKKGKNKENKKIKIKENKKEKNTANKKGKNKENKNNKEKMKEKIEIKNKKTKRNENKSEEENINDNKNKKKKKF